MSIYSGTYLLENGYIEYLNEAKNEISIKGVVCSDDNGYTNQLKDSIKFIESKWNNILDEVSKRMFKQSEIINNRYKNKDELKKDLKLLYWDFDLITASKTGIIYNIFSLSFDTNPSIDKYHHFTLYVKYNPDNNHIAYESVYDG